MKLVNFVSTLLNVYLFKNIKVDSSSDTVRFRILCKPRWTVCNDTYYSIVENYTAPLEMWEILLNDCLDSEVLTRVNGIESHMRNFSISLVLLCFAVFLGTPII